MKNKNKSTIIWYCREGKVCPAILWNTLISRNCRINTLQEGRRINKSGNGGKMSKSIVHTDFNSFSGKISEKGNYIELRSNHSIFIPVSKINLVEKI